MTADINLLNQQSSSTKYQRRQDQTLRKNQSIQQQPQLQVQENREDFTVHTLRNDTPQGSIFSFWWYYLSSVIKNKSDYTRKIRCTIATDNCCTNHSFVNNCFDSFCFRLRRISFVIILLKISLCFATNDLSHHSSSRLIPASLTRRRQNTLRLSNLTYPRGTNNHQQQHQKRINSLRYIDKNKQSDQKGPKEEEAQQNSISQSFLLSTKKTEPLSLSRGGAQSDSIIDHEVNITTEKSTTTVDDSLLPLKDSSQVENSLTSEEAQATMIESQCTSDTTATKTTTTSQTQVSEHLSELSPSSVSTVLSLLQRIRQAVFPIYGSTEITKFLLLGSIKFFIILALTLTRDCKDTLVVTQCGAEAIAFLKIYGVLPAAALYIAWYSRMSDILPNKSALFYATCVPFFAFFAIFDWFIYPFADKIFHPTLASVQKFIPGSSSTSMYILANIVAHWTSALFYVVSEIYSSVSVGLLFWQYANDVVSVDQAKRFYPLFAQMSGIAPIVAGQYVVKYASTASTFQQSLHRLTNAVSFAGIMICYFYSCSRSFLERTESERNTSASVQGMKTKKKKPKMSMMESMRFLAGSEYLRLIATLVIGYGLSINLTEILWKSLVKQQYPDPLQYQRYMGQFSSIVGFSTCIVIFFGVHVIRILGWKIGAMATPAVMAIVSIPFFACVLWPSSTSGADSNGLMNPTRLATAVLFGTLNSLLSKTSKYALFDPTTQMAYIPLDEDSKVKGKAAIDVLGSRVGKSGGSFIQQGLVLLFGGSILSASPALCVLYYAVLLAWLNGAHKLSALFAIQSELYTQDNSLQLHETIDETAKTLPITSELSSEVMQDASKKIK